MNISADDIKAIVGFVSLFVVPATHYAYNLLLQHMTAARSEQIQSLAQVVVQSVEQQLSGQPGPDKKAAAESTLNVLIKDFGLSRFASPTLVNAAIECAVQLMNASSAQAQPASVASASSTEITQTQVAVLP